MSTLTEILEELYLDNGDVETLEWYRMSPSERFAESQKLWTTFVALGGRIEPQPDSQSPFDPPR